MDRRLILFLGDEDERWDHIARDGKKGVLLLGQLHTTATKKGDISISVVIQPCPISSARIACVNLLMRDLTNLIARSLMAVCIK